MSEYYEALNRFGLALGKPCRSAWAQECVILAAASVCAEFEAYLTEDQDPHVAAALSLSFWTEYLERVEQAERYYRLAQCADGHGSGSKDISAIHGELWGDIYPVFGEQTLEELKAILRKRLMDNNLDERFFKDKAVLDMGCGGGRFSFVAKEYRAKKVLGIDWNEKNIEFANKRVAQLGLCGIEFHVGTVYETGEPDASYDIVVANGVFHHLTDPQAAYNESTRVLKTGGHFFCYVEAKGGIINELQEVVARNLCHIPQGKVFETLTRYGFSDHSCIYLLDFFFAHYEYVPADTIHERLRRAGYSRIEQLRGEGMHYDHGYFQRAKDRWREKKYGDGQLRLLATK